MSDADKDPVLRRAIEELRRLPAVDAARVRQVVSAAAAARVTPAADELMFDPAHRTNATRVWAAAGLLAAAVVIGFVGRGMLHRRPPLPQTAAVPAQPLVSAATRSSDVVPFPQQFVFRSDAAHRVSVVGDFNDWNPNAAPLARSADGALWSTIVPVMPGRHLYGFMIDDSSFVLDPRAPKAQVPDLGSQGSVVIVGRP